MEVFNAAYPWVILIYGLAASATVAVGGMAITVLIVKDIRTPKDQRQSSNKDWVGTIFLAAASLALTFGVSMAALAMTRWALSAS